MAKKLNTDHLMIMSNSSFYRELYRFLDIEDVGKWGWVNLSDNEYKNIELELLNRKRDEKDQSYNSEEKKLYPLRLKLRLKRFLYSYAKAAEKSGMNKLKSEKVLKQLGDVCDALVKAYNKAAGGERSVAIDILFERIFNNIQLTDFNQVLIERNEELRKKLKYTKLPEDKTQKEVYLYRMRPTEKYELFEEDGLSHIPFNLAHNTSNERYSICGLPSLYLASSVYDCWMEMNCPRIETVNVALFKPKEDIKFLDLCYPDAREEYDGKRIMLLPVIVACDMVVKYPEANYKYEYTIPQLILECLVKYRNKEMQGKALGIRYISIKRKTAKFAYSHNTHKRLYYNYVFPPVEIRDEGQCLIIKDSFRFEKATTSFYMQNIEKELPLFKEFDDDYERSLFFRLERHLRNTGILTYNTRIGALI